MSIICGFNGFQQIDAVKRYLLNSFVDNEIKLAAKCFELQNLASIKNFRLVVSWAYIIVFQGDTISLCGFYGGNFNQIQTFKTPNNSLILQLSCNRQHVFCVTSDGSCWQLNLVEGYWRNLSGILFSQKDDLNSEASSTLETSIKICCGETLTAVLSSRGEVYNIPNKLTLGKVKVVDIACGRSHVLMLSDSGDVYSVGEGSRGQLGHGELEEEEEPRLVQGLAGLRVVVVACGGWHSCAVTADGDLYTWGWDMSGQLGLRVEESKSQVSVQALPQVVDWPNEVDAGVVKVACGSRHTVVLLSDGSVWGCGWNKYGQLALPGVESMSCMTKLPVTQGQFRDVVCGPWNTCLLP